MRPVNDMTAPQETITFEPSLPSVVKSIRQRDLLNAWLRLPKRDGGLPCFADHQPGQVADELIDMMVYEVRRDSGEPRFLIVHEGAHLLAAYGSALDGSAPAQKRYLDVAIGPKRYQNVIASYLACVGRRRPIYSVAMVKDQDGKEVAYERLLLPFGDAGEVDHIVGSFKTISIEGGFKIRNLMSLSAETPVTVTRAVIDGNFVPRRAKQTPDSADEIVER